MESLYFSCMHVTTSEVTQWLVTCDAQDNTTQRNPSIFPVPSEVIYYVHWIKGTENTDIMYDEVIHSSASNQNKPHSDDCSKGIPNLVCTITLD